LSLERRQEAGGRRIRREQGNKQQGRREGGKMI